jgi:endonuclease/exonuclease/phosphatase family metal-dependent hydrolase
MALATCAPGPRPPETIQPAPTLRVLAYNIRHGEGIDRRVDLERVARVINRIRPDVVTLQEVDSAVQRTAGVDQARRLAELTGMQAVFGSFMGYQGGQYGMAILSRHPIVEFTNHRLPDGEEPRTALAAVVQLRDANLEFVIVGIHFYRTAEERLAQARRVVEIFQEEHRPVILSGDFNSAPDSHVLRLLQQSWAVAGKGLERLTFPADTPDREIDFIMYRPAAQFSVARSLVVDEPLASDHRPVLVELILK